MKKILLATASILLSVDSDAAVLTSASSQTLNFYHPVVWGETIPTSVEYLWFTTSVPTTVELDVETSTIRVYGAIPAVTLTTGSVDNLTQLVGFGPPQFPFPPETIYESGTLTISASLTIPATVFDTGFRPFSWNGSSYSFDGDLGIGSLNTLLAVGYEFTTEQEMFSDNVSLNRNYDFLGGQRSIAADNYPSSVAVPNFLRFSLQPTPAVRMESVAANNGFDLQITIIPEPQPTLLLGITGLMVTVLRRRHRS